MQVALLCALAAVAAAATAPPALSDGVLDDPFAGGLYMVSQAFFDDAPDRYQAWIQDALDTINSQTFEDYVSGKSCDGLAIHIYWSSMDYQVALVDNSIDVQITEGGFNVTATITAKAIVNVYAKYKDYYVFFCVDWASCCGDWTVESTWTFNAYIKADWSGSYLALSSSFPCDPAPVWTAVAPSHCDHESDIMSYVMATLNGEINDNICSTLKDTLATEAVQLQALANAPFTYSPFSQVFITYQLAGWTIVAGQYVEAQLQNQVFATSYITHHNVTFDPSSDPDSALYPPTGYTLSYTKGDDLFYNIGELRLSSTLLTALLWASDTIGELNIGGESEVLDATLFLNMTWDQPYIGIPADFRLYWELEWGVVNSTCIDSETGVLNPVLLFSFSGLTGNGYLNWTTDPAPAITMSIDEFDTDNCTVELNAPPLPLPTEELTNALLSLMTDAIPTINDCMPQMTLPANFVPYLPNPTLHTFNQAGAVQPMHGYAALESACQCGSASVEFDECGFDCSTPKRVKEREEREEKEREEREREREERARQEREERERRMSESDGDGSEEAGLFVSVFTGPGNSGCSLATTTDGMDMIFLPSTSGDCLALPDYASDEWLWGGGFYSSIPSGAITIGCEDDSCSPDSCVFSTSGNNAATVNMCFAPDGTSSLLVQHESAGGGPPCVGGVDNGNQALSVFLYTFSGSEVCAQPSAGGNSLSLSSMGAAGSCSEKADGTYVKVSEDATDQYAVATCSAACSTCDDTLYFPLGQCNPVAGANLTLSTMMQLQGSVNGPCGVLPRPEEAHDFSGLWILISIAVLALVVVLGWWLLYRCPRDPADWCCTECKMQGQKPPLRILVAEVGVAITGGVLSLYDRHRRKAEKWQADMLGTVQNGPEPGDDIVLILLIFATVGQGANAACWLMVPPFAAFDDFDEVGLDDDVINVKDSTRLFSDWTVVGQLVAVGVTFLYVGLVVLRFQTKRYETWRAWVVRSSLLSLVIQYGTLTFPPIVLRFADTVLFRADSSSILTDPDGGLDDLNTAFGADFAMATLTYLSNLFIFFMSGVTFGFLVATLVVCVVRVRADAVPTTSAETMLRVTVCMLCLVWSFASLLPVVVLYQSLALKPIWLGAWVLLWLLPGTASILCARLIDQWINNFDRRSESGRGSLLFAGGVTGRGSLQAPSAEEGPEAEEMGVITKALLKITVGVLFFVAVSMAVIVLGEHRISLISVDFSVSLLASAFFTSGVMAVAYWQGEWPTYEDAGAARLSLASSRASGSARGSRGGSSIGYSPLATRPQRQEESAAPEPAAAAAVAAAAAGEEEEEEVEAVRKPLMPPTIYLNGYQLAWRSTCCFVGCYCWPPLRFLLGGVAMLFVAIGLGLRYVWTEWIVRSYRWLCASTFVQSGAGQVATWKSQWEHDENCFWWAKMLFHFLRETTERGDRSRYGNRMNGRRFWYLLAVSLYSKTVFDDFHEELHPNIKQEVKDFFDGFGVDLSWPSDNDGGTILDEAFTLFGNASRDAYIFRLVSYGLLVLAVLSDLSWRSKSGLWRSRFFGFASMLVLTISLMSTALPNYLAASHLNEIIPTCAPEFDELAGLLASNIVGVFVAAAMAYSMTFVLFAVPPTLARVTMLTCVSDESKGLITLQRAAVLEKMFALAGIATAPITLIPLMVVQQLFGGNFASALILLIWTVPPAIAYCARTESLGFYYGGYMAAYGSLVLILLIHEAETVGLLAALLTYLKSVDTWLDLIAEVAMANAVLGDLYVLVLAQRDEVDGPLAANLRASLLGSPSDVDDHDWHGAWGALHESDEEGGGSQGARDAPKSRGRPSVTFSLPVSVGGASSQGDGSMRGSEAEPEPRGSLASLASLGSHGSDGPRLSELAMRPSAASPTSSSLLSSEQGSEQ